MLEWKVHMPLDVFISYSPKDRELQSKLAIALSNLRNLKLIRDWQDEDISPGSEWKKQILAHLDQAHIILLLISPDFMASEFCYSIEMQHAIARHDNNQARVISGLGGIGKTQLAIEYAYRYRNDYQYAFWVRADVNELLVSDFNDIASSINLPIKDEKDQGLIVGAVKNWLQTHAGWLLI